MRRRPALALIALAVALAGWLVVRTRDSVDPTGVNSTGALAASPPPASPDADGLAAPGRLRAGDGRPEPVPATDGPTRSPVDEIDDFPRVDTATLEIGFEPPPDDRGVDAHDPFVNLHVSLRSPGGGYATDIERPGGAATDFGGVSVILNGVPSGDRIVMARDGDHFWTPEVVPVVAPRTTCRLKFHRGDLARFTLAAQGREGPVGATIDVYDGTSYIDSVEVNKFGQRSPGEFAYLADRPLTFVCSGYPGSRSAGAPEPITVAGRAGHTTDVTFETPTATKVHLFTADADGAPVASGVIYVWRGGGAGGVFPCGEEYLSPTGEATIDLVPGPYEGRVFGAVGYAPRTIRFEVLHEPIQRLDVVLEAEAPATVRIRRWGGAPRVNSQVWGGAIDVTGPAGAVGGASTTDSAGAVRLPLPPRGPYRFAVDGWLSDPIELRSTSEVLTIEEPERRVGDASLTLVVLGPSGRPMDKAIVRIVREGDRWGPFTAVHNGWCSFSGLERGSWRVEVLSSWILPEQARSFEGRMILKFGETRHIEIRLKPR